MARTGTLSNDLCLTQTRLRRLRLFGPRPSLAEGGFEVARQLGGRGGPAAAIALRKTRLGAFPISRRPPAGELSRTPRRRSPTRGKPRGLNTHRATPVAAAGGWLYPGAPGATLLSGLLWCVLYLRRRHLRGLWLRLQNVCRGSEARRGGPRGGIWFCHAFVGGTSLMEKSADEQNLRPEASGWPSRQGFALDSARGLGCAALGAPSAGGQANIGN